MPETKFHLTWYTGNSYICKCVANGLDALLSSELSLPLGRGHIRTVLLSRVKQRKPCTHCKSVWQAPKYSVRMHIDRVSVPLVCK